MSDNLTEREREYLACEIPLISGGQAAGRLIGGFFVSLLQAAFTPGTGKADTRLMRTAKEIKYSKYKKAVLRKEQGEPKKNDEKLLEKLNKKEFIFADETFDNDEFTRKIYEDYMREHTDNR